MRLSRYLTVEHLDDTVYVHHGTAGTFNSFPDTLWRRVVDFCDGGDDGSTIADELETLVRAGMLVGDSVDELALLERRYRASRHGGGLGLTVVTSLGCNFDCPYCFESKRPSLVKPEVRAALIGLVEDAIAADGTTMQAESLEALEEYWEQAKKTTGQTPENS